MANAAVEPGPEPEEGADRQAQGNAATAPTASDAPKEKMRKLRALAQEVDDLTHRGVKLARWSEAANSVAGPTLDELCDYASRIATAPPARFPTAGGFPLLALPPGYSLPHPTVQVDFPKAVLRWAQRKSPPPDVTVTPRVPGDPAAGWEVRLRALPPATFAIFTTDGTLPRTENKSTWKVPDAKYAIPLSAGGLIFAAAYAYGLMISDSVTIKAPRLDAGPGRPPPGQQPSARPPPKAPNPGAGAGVGEGAASAREPQRAKPKAKAAGSGFLGGLMLSSDSEEDSGT